MMHEDQVAGAHPPFAPIQRRRVPVRRIVLAAIALVIVVTTLWALRQRQRAAASAAAASANAVNNRIVPVLTAQVARRDVPITLEGLGNVAAFYTVTVKTQVDGRIDKVLFVEGQHVKKGDALVQIDPRPFAIQLESAQAALARDTANLKNARVNLDRYKVLAQQNLIAVQQMTDQEASVAQLDAQVRADQAQIDTAKLNLDYARITSPIDGVTGVRQVDPGNVVHVADSTGLVVVTELDPIAVFFTLPEDDLPAITTAMAGGPLSVEALARGGDRSLGHGLVSVIDNQINQATATVRLKAIFDNKSRLLWPNQFVKARVELATKKDALVIPAAVVQHGPQGTFAYVVNADNTVAVRPVVIDTLQGDTALVKSGLAVGEQVVVDGQSLLRPGARVAPKAAPASSPPP